MGYPPFLKDMIGIGIAAVLAAINQASHGTEVFSEVSSGRRVGSTNSCYDSVCFMEQLMRLC